MRSGGGPGTHFNFQKLSCMIVEHSSLLRAESRRQKGSTLSRKAFEGSMSFLTLQDVSTVTKKFSKKLGEGSFGPVYYGKLPDGREVAVKVKSADSRHGVKEFVNEVCL